MGDGHDLDPDQLDQLVDELLSNASGPDNAHAELAAMNRVRALASEPLPEATRDRHLASIRASAPATARAATPASGWFAGFTRRLVPTTAAAALVLVVFTGGAVAIAQEADPDSALYGLKQTSEQVWLALPRSSERQAEAHLAIADRRMDEADRAPQHATVLVAAAISNVEVAAEEKPEEAVARLAELVRERAVRAQSGEARGGGVAIAALHRNCMRIAAKHDITVDCGPTPDVVHPGRGQGDGPRGWGAGGRPEGVVGPPPHSQGRGDDLDDE